MCQLSPVTFHGDTIFCIDYQNQPYTPMKPIVENLGLDWATQFRKLKNNESRWGIVIMTTAIRGTVTMFVTVPLMANRKCSACPSASCPPTSTASTPGR